MGTPDYMAPEQAVDAHSASKSGAGKSLEFLTYDANAAEYRWWAFGSSSGPIERRSQWNAASRGFHWRSIDMPPGWIGTGFNRWIDDDTFDNQALIKDETGRVLLDGSQDKRRKK